MEQARGLEPNARAICGYSLGGLFALYALTHASAFTACACLSGSVWYEGWVEHLRELDLDLSGRFAYLSLGTKERRAARPLLKTVQDRMEACAEILRERGAEVEYRMGPGNHLQHIPERYAAGITALDAFLTR
jgi:predicted alpha/beta superfamily hydrolase